MNGHSTTPDASGKIRLLYLVSLGYSGSTLAALLLGSHEEIATVGELSGPDPRIPREEHPCSCGSTTLNCPMWRRIEQRLAARGIVYSVFDQEKRWRCSNNRYVNHVLTRVVRTRFLDRLQGRLLGQLVRVREFLELRARLMREILDHFQASVFLDTDKEIDRLQVLRRNPDLDIRILHLVRDGRGQFCSQIRRGRNPAAAARRIARYDLQAAKLKDLLGSDRYMLVRYEDICSDPHEHLGRVAEFAGLNPGGFPETFLGTDMHVFGNPMSRDFNGHIQLDERWRRELDSGNLALFRRIAGRRNREFGYA